MEVVVVMPLTGWIRMIDQTSCARYDLNRIFVPVLDLDLAGVVVVVVIVVPVGMKVLYCLESGRKSGIALSSEERHYEEMMLNVLERLCLDLFLMLLTRIFCVADPSWNSDHHQ